MDYQEDDYQEEKPCDLCGRDFMVTTIMVSIDNSEDECYRNTAEVCVHCLCLYDDNISLMARIVSNRLASAEEEEINGTWPSEF